MEVNIHHAKAKLSRLIAAAESGEEVIIARNGKAAVRLVPVQQPATRSRREMWGAGIGKIRVSPDWNSKETNEEIAASFYNMKNFD